MCNTILIRSTLHKLEFLDLPIPQTADTTATCRWVWLLLPALILVLAILSAFIISTDHFSTLSNALGPSRPPLPHSLLEYQRYLIDYYSDHYLSTLHSLHNCQHNVDLPIPGPPSINTNLAAFLMPFRSPILFIFTGEFRF